MVVQKRTVVPQQPNFLINAREKKDNVSVKINRIFVIIQIVLSLDFGFAKYTTLRQKWMIKMLTLFQSFTVSIVCIVFFCLHLRTFQAVWYSIFCLEYVTYVVILVFSDSKKTFAVLQKDLTSFDSMIGVNSASYNLDVSIISSCLAIVLFRILLCCFYCTFNPDSCITIPVIRIIYFIPLFCIDIVLVIYFFTFYFVYRRMKNFTDVVKTSTNIIHCQYLYKTIAEMTEKVKDTFDGVFLASLLFNAPECMASVFFTLKQITSDGKLTSTSAFGGYLVTTQSLIVIFSPAFSAGLLAAEVQKIKLILHDKLFLERDQKHTKDIVRLISYIEARPLRFTICKIIPLDWNLPFIVLNLCITYLIVVIQFTHLY